ncbi:predicted protein [Sclerotinia sclerotiorum 1980 UF-70]|uniref:Uncharacterized protein n=2 Tax=Sclerotinia sclerotiorum (strain ATCC 18683 / 1980 / Ss-1) TaxID=665079 RepID=A7EA00_SCLS1|nr:predicted protein [Sclerotinia sclerotiorum 1980 UF-70]APA08445.1 hypothetical protein sscle_04g032150 [Sclerotinia sclerotiorum 1980 UF-70]EDN99278.1 predicted protein [Sclerotinia sclerotiorum 1980 UF-70]
MQLRLMLEERLNKESGGTGGWGFTHIADRGGNTEAGKEVKGGAYTGFGAKDFAAGNAFDEKF